MQHHVQAGSTDDVNAILGQEKKARLIVAGHNLLRGSLDHEAPNRFAGLECFSLLLCTVGLSGVRLFLRKSRVGNGRIVYTRSENAVAASVSRLRDGGLERFAGIAFDRLAKLEIDLIGNGHHSDEQHTIVDVQQVFMQGVEDADLQHPRLFD